jgi:hypothetical protein
VLLSAGRHERPKARNRRAAGPIVADFELGLVLRVARERDRTSLLPTAEEAERAQKEAALARIVELERELAKRS